MDETIIREAKLDILTLENDLSRIYDKSGSSSKKRKRNINIYEYKIENRIGYFVFNNISSNDTCVRELLSHIKPNILSKHRRLRCFGYIINLAVKVCKIDFMYARLTANLNQIYI